MQQFTGSSPRLRGTRRLDDRPIANEPFTVHPRACGELLEPRGSSCRSSVIGSSPRLRGTLQTSSCSYAPNSQSPVHPRACGELLALADRPPAAVRFIPAPAGNSRHREPDGSSHRFIPAPAGNSRWTLLSHAGHIHRFIPAPAGNSVKGDTYRALALAVHPRACGELAMASEGVLNPHGSSPRLRGTRRRNLGERHRFRFIPAPAGNSLPTTCCQISRYGTLYTVPWDFGPGAMMKNLKLAGLVAWESPGGWVAARTLQASFRRNPRACAGSCRTCQNRNRCRSALPRQ